MTRGDRQQLPAPRNYWMMVLPLDNWRITRAHGFTVQGFSNVHKKKVERMELGDRLMFYLGDARKFGSTASISGKYFEERAALWRPETPNELYPHRVRIVPQMVLEEPELIDAFQLAPRLEYVRKWPPEDWPLALLGQLHLIPKKDFLLIEEEMRKLIMARRRATRPVFPRAAGPQPVAQRAAPAPPAAATATEAPFEPPSITVVTDGVDG